MPKRKQELQKDEVSIHSVTASRLIYLKMARRYMPLRNGWDTLLSRQPMATSISVQITSAKHRAHWIEFIQEKRHEANI